jgi:hypothetical protein
MAEKTTNVLRNDSVPELDFHEIQSIFHSLLARSAPGQKTCHSRPYHRRNEHKKAKNEENT